MEKSEREAIEKARALLNKQYNSNATASMMLVIQHGAFEKARDHADILVAISILDLALEEAVWSHCVKYDDKIKTRLFRGDKDCPGPLGSFWAKIQIARALGIVGPKAFDGLEKLRHIRNLFAHAKEPITFETKEVADLCKFSTDDSQFWGGIVGPQPDTPRAKVFGFLQLVSLVLLPNEEGATVWDQKFLGKLVG